MRLFQQNRVERRTLNRAERSAQNRVKRSAQTLFWSWQRIRPKHIQCLPAGF